MITITITVENEGEKDAVIAVLGEAEDEGVLDFGFGCEVKESHEPEQKEYNSDSKLEGERDY